MKEFHQRLGFLGEACERQPDAILHQFKYAQGLAYCLGYMRSSHRSQGLPSVIAFLLPLFHYSEVIMDSWRITIWYFLGRHLSRVLLKATLGTIAKSQVSQTFKWASLQLLTDHLEGMLVFKCIHGLATSFFLIESSSTGVNITLRGLLSALSLREHRNTENRFSTTYRKGAELWNTTPFCRIRNVKNLPCTVYVKFLTPKR